MPWESNPELFPEIEEIQLPAGLAVESAWE